MEPIIENVKADVEEKKQETNDFTTNSYEVMDKTTSRDPAFGTLEDKEIESLSIDNVDQQVLALKEGKADFEELNGVNKEPNQLVDLIISPLPEEPIISSEEQAVVSKVEKDGKVIKIPHIEFIFGDKLLMFEDCYPLVPSQQLIHWTEPMLDSDIRRSQSSILLLHG